VRQRLGFAEQLPRVPALSLTAQQRSERDQGIDPRDHRVWPGRDLARAARANVRSHQRALDEATQRDP
jgi:hypothetical protein